MTAARACCQRQGLADGPAQELLAGTDFVKARAVAVSLGHRAVGADQGPADQGQQDAQQADHDEDFQQGKASAAPFHGCAPLPALRTCRVL
jgi:hypothetical protein